MSIIIITGERGCGKSTYAAQLIRKYPDAGGILTRGYLDPATGRKDLYVIEDVVTKEKRILMEHSPDPRSADVGRFRVNSNSFRWAIEVLEDAKECEPILIDELGPLELSHKGYYDVASKLIESGRGLILVIRSQILEQMLLLLGLDARDCDIHTVG